MDVGKLHECFLGTLQADNNVRTQAEQTLSQAKTTRGFLGACLDILDSAEVALPVKKACLIYFKNVIINGWDTPNAIDHDEKPVVRDRLVPTLVHADRSMKPIFVPVLNEILVTDYPAQWPGFLESTVALMSQTEDLDSLYSGLLCFAELCRKYRWMKNADRAAQLDPIVAQYFPSIVRIGKQLVADPAANDSRWELGEIVKLTLKCYKFVTYLDLPEPLQQPQALSDWIGFHVETMNMALPPSAMNIDEDERHLSPWVKAQKWAYSNIYNIYLRFGSKGWLTTNTYAEFRTLFAANVVPELLNVYFQKVQEWRQGARWISDASFYQIISFVEYASTKKSAWQLIKPYLATLIAELAFPLLCPRDSELELFENDPHEYIMMTFAIDETKSSPKTAVHSLIATLVQKRPKVALEPVLQFAYEKLSTLAAVSPETLDVAKQKSAALQLIEAISSELVKEGSPFKPQLESFLASLVFPNFRSAFGFLRANTCDVSSKFGKVQFEQQESLSMLFQGVMDCFNETDHLPVQFEAAQAIKAFIDFPQFKEALGTIVVPTTEKLLALATEMDSDNIPIVIQSLVENYSKQLEPFGVSLMEKLTEQLLRLLGELRDVQNSNPTDFNTDELGSKTNAALGVFGTIITVLLFFENSAEKIGNLESIYAPVLQFVLRNDLDSFFAETFEMVENTTFLTRRVSPTMWTLFEDSINALLATDLSLYLEDAMPALKNYLVYGTATFKSNKQYDEAIMRIVLKVLNGEGEDEFALDEILHASELATYFLLALDAATAADFVGPLVQQYLKLLMSDDPENSSIVFKTMVANVIVAAMVVAPSHCIQSLVELNMFDQFFKVWGQLCTSYKRVFDLKLSILGLLSFLSVDAASLASMHLDGFLPVAGASLAVLLSLIPGAISEMEKKRKQFDAEGVQDVENILNPTTFIPAGIHGSDDEDDEDAGGWEDTEYEEGAEEEGGEEGDNVVIDSDYIEQFGFAAEEDFDEDPYVNTPLDSVNVFGAFKDFIVGVQASDPAKYSQIILALTQEQRDTLTSIVQIAS